MIWSQENLDVAQQDMDVAWQAYKEMFEATLQRGAEQPGQTPGPVYAYNLHQAHEAWWHAAQEYQQRLDDNAKAQDAERG